MQILPELLRDATEAGYMVMSYEIDVTYPFQEQPSVMALLQDIVAD